MANKPENFDEVWNNAASQETGLATVEAVGRRLQDILPVQSGTLAQLQTAEERSYVLDFPSQSAERRLRLHLVVCRALRFHWLRSS